MFIVRSRVELDKDSRVCLEVTRIDCIYELLSEFDHFLLARWRRSRLAMKKKSVKYGDEARKLLTFKRSNF